MLTGEEFWRLAELEGGEDPAVVGEFGAELSLGAVEEPEQSWCCWGGSGGTGGPRTCPAGRGQPPTVPAKKNEGNQKLAEYRQDWVSGKATEKNWVHSPASSSWPPPSFLPFPWGTGLLEEGRSRLSLS